MFYKLIQVQRYLWIHLFCETLWPMCHLYCSRLDGIARQKLNPVLLFWNDGTLTIFIWNIIFCHVENNNFVLCRILIYFPGLMWLAVVVTVLGRKWLVIFGTAQSMEIKCMHMRTHSGTVIVAKYSRHLGGQVFNLIHVIC